MHRLTFFAIVFTSSLASVAEDRLPGFDSPEQAFRAYVTGAITEDFDLMLSSLTPEAKAYHIGLAIFSAVFLFSEDPAMQKVLRDHGLVPSSDDPHAQDEPDEPSSDDPHAQDKPDEKVAEKMYIDAMLKIKDPGKLMRQIADRHEELAKLLAKSDDARANTKQPTEKELISSVTLENVTITDDSATASVHIVASAKHILNEIPDKIQFRRINKRWYCDIDPR